MSPRRPGPEKPKEKGDNIVILYSVLFCIVLVIYIRYIL
jgi:hypothetical protein